MAEKLLVCDALDDRDFLNKKIKKAIKNATFVGSKRIKDNKVGVVPSDAFIESAKSDYQSIIDLIKRYRAIDVAITLANATTDITTRSGKTMTRAAAIALKKSIAGKSDSSMGVDFDGLLLHQMTMQYQTAVEDVEVYNNRATKELEGYKVSLVGKDTSKKLSEDDIKMIESLTADLKGEFVDPIGIKNKIDELSEEHDNLIKELDTAIKISNATTYIEI
jgi:hypothetical protein